MSVLDLIDRAIDDCAVSDDAVRYNAPPKPEPPAPGVLTYDPLPGIRAAMQRMGTEMGKLFDALYIDRRARMRRMHTAHPARWRRL